MTLFTTALAVLAVTVPSASTEAHVAPSVDDNNRYLKVTPMRGGFRLAYTVFFGEIPGASERKLIDANRDGRIDEGEARRFGDKLASEVAASLELESGGRTQRVAWAVVDVGLGSTAVAAGAFSVDMIGYLCASGSLSLKDQFRIQRPGETEVLVEDSPGVTVQVARIGPSADPRRDWRFLGAGGPLSDDGLTVQWTAEPTAPALPSGGCAAGPDAANGGTGSSRLPFVFGALVVVCAAVAGVIVGRRARRRSRPA
jgi:hypothetical protein